MKSKSIRWATAAAVLHLVFLNIGSAHGQVDPSPPAGPEVRTTAPSPAPAPPATDVPPPQAAPGPTVPPPPVSAEPATTPPTVMEPSATSCCILADGTQVSLEIAEPLSSKTAQPGQRFKLRLATPLQIDGAVLLAAGTEGEGEVIHADRARAGGKPGELILAARFLNGPAGEIKLRGMKLGGIGKDNSGAANAVLAGTTVAAPVLAPIALLVRGGNLEIPVGTPAQAKLAGALHLPPLQAEHAYMEASGATEAPASGEGAPTTDSKTPSTSTPQD